MTELYQVQIRIFGYIWGHLLQWRSNTSDVSVTLWASIISYYNIVLSNIAENNFMTDCVALFWCHSTAACRVIRGVVLNGHAQKSLKRILNFRWTYLIHNMDECILWSCSIVYRLLNYCIQYLISTYEKILRTQKWPGMLRQLCYFLVAVIGFKVVIITRFK